MRKFTTLNFDLARGDNFTIPLRFYNADGTYKDITGATIYFTAKTDPDLSEETASNITIDYTSHEDAENGLSNFTIDATNSDLFIEDQYHYNLRVVLTGGAKYTMFAGIITVPITSERRS